LASDLKDLKQNLTEVTLVHDDATLEKAQLELEMVELKDYVLVVHFERFNQAVH